jgi:hypothetical protein
MAEAHASLRKRIRRWIRRRVAERIGVHEDLQVWWTPELPIVYVSNPKSGCSTIKNSLKQAQSEAYSRSGLVEFARKTNPHLSDDCLRNFGMPTGGRRLVVSSVRNPYARALSGYLDMVEGRDNKQYPEAKYWKLDTFEAFLTSVATSVASRDPLRLNSHFRPQHINLDLPAIPYDAIVFLENLEILPVLLGGVLGGAALQKFAPHARDASARIDRYYTPRTVELVRQIYGRDFECFHYSDDLADATLAPGAYIGMGGLVRGFDGIEPLSPCVGVTPLLPSVRFRQLVRLRLL